MTVVLKSPRSAQVVTRSSAETEDLVAQIIADIRSNGDDAVRKYSEQFDNWSPSSFQLSRDEIDKIVSSLPETVLDDLRFAQTQVRVFAQHQRDSISDFEMETLPGVILGHRNIPVNAAGAYVPGGRYPLTASAHMTVVTARVAEVPRIMACTPPTQGTPPPISVAAMDIAGADEIYALGGVQAVAAMALGTESIDRVNIVVGPGNAFVAEAKRQLYGEVGIDLFAGPTEVLIIADHTADPFVIAVDLLSQAEHGPDSPAVLITTSERVGQAVIGYIAELLPGLVTKDVAAVAWRDFGEVHVVEDLEAAYALGNTYASEHVEVLTENPRAALESMTDYGAIFLGEGTCVPYGDKVIGTNHVLPTLGAARYTGGLWVGKFLKTVTYQEVTDRASSVLLGRVCGRASRLERFEGHARSGDVRVAKYAGEPLAWSDHTFDQPA